MTGQQPEVAVALSSVGRPRIADLLASLAASSVRPVAVAVADQSAGALRLDPDDHPFPLVVVASSGGASRGRNDAVAALRGAGDVFAFPNDDSTYPPELLAGILPSFAGPGAADAVAVRLDEAGGPRFRLPPPGEPLDRRTVWRAIEPAMFVRRAAFEAVGGFDPVLGTGAGTPWGSGEGTDLLLRILRAGGPVISRSDLAVIGTGERRDLDEAAFVHKHRAYARGTGYVYRVHDYPLRDRLRTLAGPLVTARRQDPRLRLSLILSAARFVGRVEGLTARTVAWGPGSSAQPLSPPR